MFSRQELQIFIYALNQPAGVPKALREDAQKLQDKVKHLLCQPTSPPPANRVPIKSAWPENPTVSKSKPKVDKPKKDVPLIKSTTPAKKPITVESVLEGLV